MNHLLQTTNSWISYIFGCSPQEELLNQIESQQEEQVVLAPTEVPQVQSFQDTDVKNILVLNKTNPNSIYIKGTFSFAGYNKYSLHCYVDTGASMCTANKHVIPPEHWVEAQRPIQARTANDQVIRLDKVAH